MNERKLGTTKLLRVIGIILILLAVSIQSWAQRAYKSQSVESIYQTILENGPKYDVYEEIVNLENEGEIIEGTLFRPMTDKSVPIIIQLHGFYVDREWGPVPDTTETFHLYVGRLLAEQGFASLICDFRGSGRSGGEWRDTTFTSQLSDSLAIVDYAAKLEGIQSNKIGVIGHSQGGLIGSLLAARDKRIKSLVLWSPVATPGFSYSDFFGGTRKMKEIMDSEEEYIDVDVFFYGDYFWSDIMCKGFFEDLFNYDPVTEISKYQNPLMVIVGSRDQLVWPQPQMGQLYIDAHYGDEYYLALDTYHSFGLWNPDVFMIDDTTYWSTAWFIKTMNMNNDSGGKHRF